MTTKNSKPETAAEWMPRDRNIPSLRKAAASCRACDLWKAATQTVFGEGGALVRLMLVGEQPGDQEDLQGKPFVGPAGRILNQALEEAGIDRSETYVTNAVKHFKWEPRGKRRIHKKPNTIEIKACRPWIEAEIGVLRPQIILCLGATAAQSLLGPKFHVSTQRGQLVESPLAPYVLATVHPASLLRAPDEETRRVETRRFMDDFRHVADILRRLPVPRHDVRKPA